MNPGAEVRRAGFVAGLALLALAAGPALAHPYDEVVQGAYLTLAPGQVRLELDLTPGPAVADALLKALDPARPAVMELGDHMGPIPVVSPEKLAFWTEVYRQQQGR